MSVQWNQGQSRFELQVEGGTAIADCVVRPNNWVVTHVEVPPALRGGGVASKLAAGMIEYVRQQGGTITPVCPFMVTYFQRHPNDKDTLSAD